MERLFTSGRPAPTEFKVFKIIVARIEPIINFMSFYKRYELRRLVAEGEARTFHAVERASGRELFLHLIGPAGDPLLAALRAEFLDRHGRLSPPLIEIGEFGGSKYAITEWLEPFHGLGDWLKAVQEEGPGAKIPPAASSLPAPSAVPSREPGEFTRLFDGAEPVAPPKIANPRPIEKPAPPRKREVVDDEVARFFESALVEEAIDVEEQQERAARSKLPESRPFQPAGEFTRLFGPSAESPKHDAPVRKASPPRLETSVSEFFGSTEEDARPGVPPEAAVAADTPGEYTRIISGLEPNCSTPKPRETVSTASIRKERVPWSIAAATCGAVLLLLVLVVYLVSCPG